MSKLLMLENFLEQDFYPNRSAFESHGFTIEQNDNIFLVTLPEGWDAVLSEAEKSSTLMDSKGNVRGTSKNKEGFGCYISLKPRFDVTYTYAEPQDPTSPVHVFVTDLLTGETIFEVGDCEKPSSDEFRQLVKKANEFLDSNYPGWSDECKYWD